ncbi:ATP-binding protein [candidate division KSB1 bacterium]|nr:ATP-binding protein [candidate division KSB1 bacterium]RQW09115.1 MAG: ATP-binding protein [candidate division KSB1 bacterium]
MELYIPRFLRPPDSSYFLFGPRGTGKSTYLMHEHPDALTVDLLKPDLFRLYSARPERLFELIAGNPDAKMVIVDEVQKVPELLDVVHSLVEQKRKITFILTGSSSRKLKRTGIDLLAGRVLLRTMHPFLLSEAKAIDFGFALQNGLLPIVCASETPADVLNAYVELYVREEVQIESMVRNVGNFTRFLEAASFSHASVLNMSNIARECAIERKVVEGYIAILQDILLAFKIPVFTKRARRAVSSHPKFYFFDTGVFRTLRPKGPLDRPEEIDGAALEGLVAQHLRAWIAYSQHDNSLYFWRSRKGVEVDFVVYGERELVALEVKNSSRVRPEDLRSLEAFREDYPEGKTYLLYRGSEKLRIKDILCLPCDYFLSHLVPDMAIGGIQ